MLAHHAQGLNEAAADELSLFAQRVRLAEEYGMIFSGASHSETGISAHWFHERCQSPSRQTPSPNESWQLEPSSRSAHASSRSGSTQPPAGEQVWADEQMPPSSQKVTPVLKQPELIPMSQPKATSALIPLRTREL